MVSIKSIIRLVSIACLALLTTECSQSISYAANICDPVTGSNCVEVNSAATGGGAHTSEYDLRDQFTGQKATYTASTTALTATASGTPPFFSICGSATKTIRVQRLNINQSIQTAGALARKSITLRKTSTATSGGTATALVQVPHDSNSAAGTASLVNYYTVLPTAGTLVGTVGSRVRTIFAAVAATDFVIEMVWEFVGRESEAIVLRGTAECLEAGMDTAGTVVAPTYALSVTWTEE